MDDRRWTAIYHLSSDFPQHLVTRQIAKRGERSRQDSIQSHLARHLTHTVVQKRALPPVSVKPGETIDRPCDVAIGDLEVPGRLVVRGREIVEQQVIRRPLG